MTWFGEPWPSAVLRAPVCERDVERVPVPVGAPCLFCGEPIDEHDRGTFINCLREDGPTREPVHIECSMREVLGPIAYLEGRCRHAGGTEECQDPSLTTREDALATWRWVHEHGVLR